MGKIPNIRNEQRGSRSTSTGFFVTPDQKKKMLKVKEASEHSKFRFQKKQPTTSSNAKRPNFPKNNFRKRSESDISDVNTSLNNEEIPKKVFDKKKWRLQKYSNKYKLQQHEEKKKKVILRDYYRKYKDDVPKFDVQKIYKQYASDDEEDNSNKRLEEDDNNLNVDIMDEPVASTSQENRLYSIPKMHSKKVSRKVANKKAHEEYERIQKEKQNKKEEMLRIKAEKREALSQYKVKKLERFKKLNKKTRKGQPIMKYRMEMLLEQIQKSTQ